MCKNNRQAGEVSQFLQESAGVVGAEPWAVSSWARKAARPRGAARLWGGGGKEKHKSNLG